MNQRRCLSIILAAGEGTRMMSALPKVLHPVAGLPMIAHVAATAAQAGAGDIAVVVGHGSGDVLAALGRFPHVETYVQERRLGTAHAVLAARAALERGYDDVLVMFGDTPLVEPEVLVAARAALADGAAVVVVGFHTDASAGYGRLVMDKGVLAAIREDRDCSPAERAITFCNGGLMALDGSRALALLDRIGNDNAKSEYYLTDIVEIARADGLKVAASESARESVLGVNNRAELAAAEAIWQRRRRLAAMNAGVTLTAPDTVHFSHDTEIGADATVEPYVVFGPGVSVAGGATVRAFSHLEGARLGAGAEVGPYARLRPGTELGEKAKIGNFVETKKAVLGAGAKINHLSYVGDAEVGARANVGAGTITCNYDGYNKYLTRIGAGAFIGSNSSLVAPVSIGDGAYVASGSVITADVTGDALAFGRARQTNFEGRGRALRDRLGAAGKVARD